MAQRIDIWEDIYNRPVNKKEQEKNQYNRGVKMQYFILSNLTLFKDSIFYLGKFIKQWQRPYIINSFGRDHGTLYILKILDKKSAPNTYYGDHLCIFHPQEKYLQPTDKELLKITHNLRFRNKNTWRHTI